MSRGYETAVELSLERGFTAWMQWLVLHVAAAAGAWLLPHGMDIVAFLIAAGSVARDWHAQRQQPWRRLHWRGWGGMELVDGNGRTRHVSPARRQFVTPWLIILTIEFEEKVLRFPLYRADQPAAVRRLHQRLTAGRWRQQLEATNLDV